MMETFKIRFIIKLKWGLATFQYISWVYFKTYHYYSFCKYCDFFALLFTCSSFELYFFDVNSTIVILFSNFTDVTQLIPQLVTQLIHLHKEWYHFDLQLSKPYMENWTITRGPIKNIVTKQAG